MAQDPLVTLFGSPAKIKLLRLFVFNPTLTLPFDDIARRAKLVRRTARTELSALERADIVRKKQVYTEVSGKNKKQRVQAYTLNEKSEVLPALQEFLFQTAPINGKTLMQHVRKSGRFDCVVATGAFMQEFDRRVDVLLASKKVTPVKVENAIRGLEAELGIEIKYAFLPTDELQYRLGMNDKLIRDVFDYPHHIFVDRVGVSDILKSRVSQ